MIFVYLNDLILICIFYMYNFYILKKLVLINFMLNTFLKITKSHLSSIK